MRTWIITGGIAGFLGVAFGAFGAHGLKSILSEELLKTYQTGVLYHLLHAVIITVIGISGAAKYSKAALLMSIGIVLFSFSLYIYSLTGNTIFAMITPLGGVCFLGGWLYIIIAGIKTDNK